MKTKLFLLITLSFLIFPNMAKSQVKVQQTAGHDVLGEFAPECIRRICSGIRTFERQYPFW